MTHMSSCSGGTTYRQLGVCPCCCSYSHGAGLGNSYKAINGTCFQVSEVMTCCHPNPTLQYCTYAGSYSNLLLYIVGLASSSKLALPSPQAPLCSQLMPCRLTLPVLTPQRFASNHGSSGHCLRARHQHPATAGSTQDCRVTAAAEATCCAGTTLPCTTLLCRPAKPTAAQAKTWQPSQQSRPAIDLATCRQQEPQRHPSSTI
jgi:hypothetical protein